MAQTFARAWSIRDPDTTAALSGTGEHLVTIISSSEALLSPNFLAHGNIKQGLHLQTSNYTPLSLAYSSDDSPWSKIFSASSVHKFWIAYLISLFVHNFAFARSSPLVYAGLSLHNESHAHPFTFPPHCVIQLAEQQGGVLEGIASFLCYVWIVLRKILSQDSFHRGNWQQNPKDCKQSMDQNAFATCACRNKINHTLEEHKETMSQWTLPGTHLNELETFPGSTAVLH